MSKNNGDKFAILKEWPIANWSWPKIVLYVPMLAALPFADDVFYNFMAIAQGGIDFFALNYNRTDVARNKAGEALLDSQFTHLLMLDSDHPHPIDIVQRLARRVLEDPERLVVGAMSFRRGEPYDPLAWKVVGKSYYTVHDWEPDSIFEVDMLATPAMLIHRSVFEKVSKPWFFYDYSMVDQPEFSWPTEDVGFCKKVRAAGIKIYCDTSIITPHMRAVKVDEKTYRTWCEMHPDNLVDPVIEKKAFSIADLLQLTPDELAARVQDAGLNVRDAWNYRDPQTPQEVKDFYGYLNNGYFYDLLAWNTSALYKDLTYPLREVKSKDVLVIGPGIGGEIDHLLGRGNAVTVKELPGAMKYWLFDFYGDKIKDFQGIHENDFDLVVAIDVIEHIHPEELAGFLNGILMYLKPGGIFYCHCNFAMNLADDGYGMISTHRLTNFSSFGFGMFGGFESG